MQTLIYFLAGKNNFPDTTGFPVSDEKVFCLTWWASMSNMSIVHQSSFCESCSRLNCMWINQLRINYCFPISWSIDFEWSCLCGRMCLDGFHSIKIYNLPEIVYSHKLSFALCYNKFSRISKIEDGVRRCRGLCHCTKVTIHAFNTSYVWNISRGKRRQ